VWESYNRPVREPTEFLNRNILCILSKHAHVVCMHGSSDKAGFKHATTILWQPLDTSAAHVPGLARLCLGKGNSASTLCKGSNFVHQSICLLEVHPMTTVLKHSRARVLDISLILLQHLGIQDLVVCPPKQQRLVPYCANLHKTTMLQRLCQALLRNSA
jgi:hypothetical protein